jgi:hypothetical protein
MGYNASDLKTYIQNNKYLGSLMRLKYFYYTLAYYNANALVVIAEAILFPLQKFPTISTYVPSNRMNAVNVTMLALAPNYVLI